MSNPDTSNTGNKPQQDEIPSISSTSKETQSSPSVINSIIWLENLFAKSLVSTLPSHDELKKMFEHPGQFILHELESNLQTAKTLLSDPASRRALAANAISEINNAFSSEDAMASSAGFVFGSILTPGGSRKFIGRMSVPEFKGEKYVEEMISRIPDDAEVLSYMKKQDIAEKLRYVRPADSGNPMMDWMIDHIPPTITSNSPFITRAYVERDLGLITDHEFSQRALTSFAMKWSSRGGIIGGAYQLFSDNKSTEQATTPTPEELKNLQTECFSLLKIANNYNDLLKHLHGEKKELTTDDKKILECISLKLIDDFENARAPTTGNLAPTPAETNSAYETNM